MFTQPLTKTIAKKKTSKKIKQINNLVIRYSEMYGYSVYTPDGRCWEDNLTLEQAEQYCKGIKDFLRR